MCQSNPKCAKHISYSHDGNGKQHVETSVMETVSFHLFQEMSEPFRHQRNGYKQLNFRITDHCLHGQFKTSG